MTNTLQFNIEGMRCDGCVSGVQTALEAVEGVSTAEVNLEEKSAQVTAGGSVTAAALIAAVEKAGFQAALK